MSKRQGQPVRFCIYCGYPTVHPSETCPVHRDLAPPIFDPIFDAAVSGDIESRDEDR